MSHPIALARHLVETFGEPSAEQVTVLEILDRWLTHADRDLRVCKDCSAAFYVTQAQEAWYLAQGLHPPVRCADCRRERKANLQSRGLR